MSCSPQAHKEFFNEHGAQDGAVGFGPLGDKKANGIVTLAREYGYNGVLHFVGGASYFAYKDGDNTVYLVAYSNKDGQEVYETRIYEDDIP